MQNTEKKTHRLRNRKKTQRRRRWKKIHSRRSQKKGKTNEDTLKEEKKGQARRRFILSKHKEDPPSEEHK